MTSDAGKSTISGQVLLKTGHVDKRLVEKYEREAKEKNRESWYLAYILDTNEEERAKVLSSLICRAKLSRLVVRIFKQPKSATLSWTLPVTRITCPT